MEGKNIPPVAKETLHVELCVFDISDKSVNF